MKRFTFLFLISLCLTFIAIELKPVFAVSATNTYTEGIYKVSDFNPSTNGVYSVSNVSASDYMGIIITDDEQNILQAIRLKPNSEKHNTIPISPNDRIILLGKGTAFINPQELTK